MAAAAAEGGGEHTAPVDPRDVAAAVSGDFAQFTEAYAGKRNSLSAALADDEAE